MPFAAYTSTAIPLSAGAYIWYVEAYGASGYITSSSVGTFTIANPAFVTYVSPTNCTTNSCPVTEPTTPELKWNPVPGAGVYRVWLALDKDFTNVVRQYSTQHTTLTAREAYLDNAAGQSYYWFVQPCKAGPNPGTVFFGCGEFGGDSLLSHERAFRKKSAPVTLLGPPNTQATNQLDVVSFSWQDYTQTTNGISGAKGYHLQVAIDSSFNTIVDDVIVDQPFYQAWAKSYPDNVYYWRVQAIDGGDAPLTFSAVWTFQKASRVPVPVAAGTTAGLPTLTWAALAYASGYTVEIYSGTNALFPVAYRVLSANTKLPSFTPSSGLAAGTYSWRVRKLDPDGNSGPWSTTVSVFTVSQTAPTLTSPADLTKVLSNNLFFTWLAVNGASSYLFESSASSGFSPTVEQVTTVMTAWAPTAAYPDRATYYWRIKVLDGDGNVMATSAVRRIDKDAVAPTVTLVTPTGGLAVDGTITVSFSEPVKGVSAAGLVLRIANTTTSVAGTVTPSSTTATTSATFKSTVPLIPGQYYDLTVGSGITDLVGNLLAVTTTRIRTAVAFENTSPALVERWDVDAATGASGGAYITSNTAGASTSFRFTGTAVSVLGHTSSTGGYADVYLDGVKKTATPISFYSATPAYQTPAYSTTGLTSAAHTLEVRVLGTKPAASTGTFVNLDAFVSGTTFQENSPAVTTRFGVVTTTGASGGTYDVTAQELDTTGAEYRFSFRGTGFTWSATKQPTGGTAIVYIDGISYGEVKLWASSVQYKIPVFTSITIADGVHAVRVVATGVKPTGSTGTNITLDSVTTR